MKIVDREVEYYGVCPSNEDDMLKHIEMCGRRCYKSEHKIDWENRSFEKFYKLLVDRGHVSAIEHSNVVVEVLCSSLNAAESFFASFVLSAGSSMSFFRLAIDEDKNIVVISGNVRAWLEFFKDRYWFLFYYELGSYLNRVYPIVFDKVSDYMTDNRDARDELGENIMDDISEIGDISFGIVSSDEHLKDFYLMNDIPIFTFAFYTDRGISHEVVRHRVLSFSQESTRYVNYKNRGIEYMGWDVPECLLEKYSDICDSISDMYAELIENGVKPQYARNILPNILKTELAVSGRLSGWQHFIDLRKSPAAHPDIQFIAEAVDGFLNEA